MSKERYRLITEYPKDEFFDNKQVVKFDSYEVIRTLNQQADKIADLEAKLAEKDRKIEGLGLYTKNVIDFAIEQLEKVKEYVDIDFRKNCYINAVELDKFIDNQIEELKKEMK